MRIDVLIGAALIAGAILFTNRYGTEALYSLSEVVSTMAETLRTGPSPSRTSMIFPRKNGQG